MGRPKKTDDDRRTETLAFRLTPAERLTIEKAAASSGLTASDFSRMQTLRGRVVVQQAKTLAPDLFDELRRIGVNLNQVARIANQTGRVTRDMTRVLTELEDILIRQIGGESPVTTPPPAPAPAAPSSVWPRKPFL